MSQLTLKQINIVSTDGLTTDSFVQNDLVKRTVTTLKTSSTGSTILPAGTTAQRDTSPLTGFIRFNTTLGKPEVYNGSMWGSVGGGATGGGSDTIFMENGQTVTSNYTITSGNNAGTFGPVSVASGITVTVPAGSTWVII